MYTLGINAAYYDSAACLVRDGVVLAASEEERYTRRKHAKRPVPFSTWELPFHAIDDCMRQAGIGLADVNHVAYSYDPTLLLGRHQGAGSITLPLEPSAHPIPTEWEAAWDPLFLSSIVNAPRQLADGAPHHLRERFRGVRSDGPYRWHFVAHHLAHAASAFHVSSFERAAVLTLDGRGEKATTGYAVGRGTDLEWLGQVQMPHSLGLLYEQVTDYLGFLHSSDEYKVMALASFGKPRYAAEFRKIVRLGTDGQYRIEPPSLVERFGPARQRGGPLEPRHFDIAQSLQVVLEESVIEIAGWLHRASGADDLCMAGGVALNCVMNARLRDRGPFRRIWVQPAAGDAGTALGAAVWIDAQERGDGNRPFVMDHAYLGPSFDDAEIEAFLKWSKLSYRRCDNVPRQTAEILARDEVIGWFQGRMEFGPRALGARSILASPIHPEIQARLNEIKDREDFRPVAPVVLEESAADWFNGASVSPFMLFVHDVRPERADRIPAVRHTDGKARIQTVNRSQHSIYYDLIRAFADRTGVPVLVNTSFNTRGEPIVCTPRDAVESYWTSPLDALVIGSFLLEKSPEGGPLMRVTVVVPTYRRPDLLDRCLAALAVQEIEPSGSEIFVADDAASAATRRQVAGWANRSAIPIRYLTPNTAHGPAAARNAGWRAGSGQVVAFTDDDCIPGPRWLAEGLAAFDSEGGPAAVAGLVIVPLPERPTDYQRDAAGLERAEFVTANCFVRRDALEAVGGFDERYAAA